MEIPVTGCVQDLVTSFSPLFQLLYWNVRVIPLPSVEIGIYDPLIRCMSLP